LAFADDALDVGERQAGKARFEEAIDAHVVLVGRHGDGLHLDRQQRLDWLLRRGPFELGPLELGLGWTPLGALARKARRLATGLAARTRSSLLRAPCLERTRFLALIARTGLLVGSFDAAAHGCLPTLKAAFRHDEMADSSARRPAPCAAWPSNP